MTVTVQRTISMGHRLPSYKGICSAPHGHNVKVNVSARVKEGFLDFKDIDGWLAQILKPLDHAMVLYVNDPFVKLLSELPESRTVLLSVEPTTEAIAQLIMNEMSTYCYVESVTVHETDKYCAECTTVSSDVHRLEATGAAV
jgi:6-pyruvoyl-tetrahydropterin synthase